MYIIINNQNVIITGVIEDYNKALEIKNKLNKMFKPRVRYIELKLYQLKEIE